jgi:hypothetical protein
MTDNPHLTKATECWGAPPDWIVALAEACHKSSQAAVARQLAVSGGLISQLLSNTYPAGTARIEERVRGLLMRAVVDCPVMGELPTNECQDWRRKAASPQLASPRAVMMCRACMGCAHNQAQGAVA